ncbi:MAG: MBL fold metallo-hydrolase [bacterium]
MSNKMKLTFWGGTGEVTGANFLLEGYGLKILVDCGLIQGGQFADENNRKPFAYNPSEIDILIITHSHIDHIGRVPKLVKDGFKGRIISSPATKELAEVMLEDAAIVLAYEAKNRGLEPLYVQDDVNQAMRRWESLDYHNKMSLSDSLDLEFYDSGHILGSVMATFSSGGKKIVFTGDLGNSPSLILRDTERLPDPKYLIMESVYGDRNHESKEERREKLFDILSKSIKAGKTILIPAFSLERTQAILYELNNFIEGGKLPSVPVFLDSPLGAKVTAIYKRFVKDMNENIKKQIFGGDDVFNFKGLKFTVHQEESQKIESTPGAKIILAGSGMSNGGRILKHEKHYLSSTNTVMVLVGYQSIGTVGRHLEDGNKTINIYHEDIPVRAEIVKINGYSSHKDSDHLFEFVEGGMKNLKKTFVVMGEPKSSMFLVQRLRENLDVDAINPQLGNSFDLEF